MNEPNPFSVVVVVVVVSSSSQIDIECSDTTTTIASPTEEEGRRRTPYATHTDTTIFIAIRCGDGAHTQRHTVNTAVAMDGHHSPWTAAKCLVRDRDRGKRREGPCVCGV